jgi:hypothetical protein
MSEFTGRRDRRPEDDDKTTIVWRQPPPHQRQRAVGEYGRYESALKGISRYPSKAEIDEKAYELGLSRKQIEHWVIQRRARDNTRLPPMRMPKPTPAGPHRIFHD